MHVYKVMTNDWTLLYGICWNCHPDVMSTTHGMHTRHAVEAEACLNMLLAFGAE